MKRSKANFKFYNPNKFNAIDGAICFIIALLTLTLFPNFVVSKFKDFFIAVRDFDTYAYMCLSIFISQGMLILIGLLFSAIKKVNPITSGGYKLGWDGVQILMAVMLTIGVMMLFYFTHIRLSEYANVLTPVSPNIPENFSVFSVIFAFVYIIEVAVFPAIVEELLFRGIIMKGFSEFGALFAVVCSAILFSLMHGSFNQMLLQFIGGLMMGAVVMITKNFLLGMIMHFTNNLFSVVYTFFITPLLTGELGRRLSAVLGGASIIFGAVFVLVGVIYFGSMLIEKEKNKVLNKTIEEKYAKKRFCGTIAGEQKCVVEYNENLINLGDQNKYYFFGKIRKINFKSPKYLTFALIGIGLIGAIVCIYFGL